MAVSDDITGWVGSLPSWQQDLVRRLLATTSLDEMETADTLSVVLASHGALDADVEHIAPIPPSERDFPSTPQPGASPRLVALGSLRGVGAVAEDTELRFAPEGLTVIYGTNAAGKSSYVRALKRVCRTVDGDSSILANVFADPKDLPDKPTARLETVDGSGTRARQVDLAAPDEPGLDVISVFDSHCAELYVDQENTVAYVPTELKLLTRLAATQNQLRTEVDRISRQAQGRKPEFAGIAGGTQAVATIESLSSKSDLEAVAASCLLTEEEQARLAELEAAVSSAKTPSGRKDIEAAQRDANDADALRKNLSALGALVGEPEVAKLSHAAAEARAAHEAVALAGAGFEALPVQGVGTDPWRLLWDAARAFVEASDANASFPPGTSASCPLCLQVIDGEAADRLAHFERHVQGDVQRRSDAADSRMREMVAGLGPEVVTRCQTALLAELSTAEPPLHKSVTEYVRVAESRRAALTANPESPGVLTPLPDEPGPEVEEWAVGRRQHAATLAAALDPEQEGELRRELDELRARVALGAQMDAVRTWVAELQRIDALKKAHSALHTAKVTRRQNELSEAVVTGALRKQLDRELAALRCEHIPVRVEGHGEVGATVLELQLVGASSSPGLRAVLSEGEQRALSLSFFFAEVACADHDGGIVMDDPVSSLDDERREYIAARLVEETKNRQVVVFTHDLPFMLDLVEHADASNVPCTQASIWRGEVPGRVDGHPPFRAMKFPQRVHQLEERVSHWNEQPPAANLDESWARVQSFYRDMRAAWERAVEERLFGSVVERFQREVKTLRFDEVRFEPALVKQVTDGMTRCSRFLHDDATRAGGSPPGRTELAVDVGALRQFERDTKAKRST